VSQSRKTESEYAKALGAFYTDSQIADFLVWWAVRSRNDTVMDPSFGGGVFLRAAATRLSQLGGNPAGQLLGSEIDPVVHREIVSKLHDEFGVKKDNLVLGDFFRLEASRLGKVDAVVGNPPFIRFHLFTGEARQRALSCAAVQGVRLSSLSSSWAPFLVHSVGMTKPGGRLAMVVPMEIAHAGYALPVLDFLGRSFGKITLLTFRRKLFPHLSEDTLLLLAENKDASPAKFVKRDFNHLGQLAEIQRGDRLPLAGTRIDGEALQQGRERLIEYLVPKKARELYRKLKHTDHFKSLGELADVGIGYVTGANDFFHLTHDDVRTWKFPERYLRPAVRRGRALAGLRFLDSDWIQASRLGEAGYLLFIESAEALPETVRRYLKHGAALGVDKSYKCRTRSPWFRVPHVYEPDGFLSYMSGALPSLVSNDACAVAPNSLHILRLHPNSIMPCDAIAASWQTSVTRLSAEIEGHSMGGGMLKIEPSEAERVLLAAVLGSARRVAQLTWELDQLIRRGNWQEAQMRADNIILKDIIGLDGSDCSLLRCAARQLRERRSSRSLTA
jgi:adenine-specific DNA-methyltransferase